jgi:hypothetical protein
MFWSFIVWLLIISFIFPFIFSLLSIPLIGLMALLFAVKETEQGKQRKPLSFLSYPVMALIFLANVYILSGWSAYVASRALVYSSAPEVTHKWIYYLVGFVLCHGPLGYMASKEGREGASGSCLHTGIAMVMYIIFSIWPRAMIWPYGWFLRWIYE